MAYKLRNRQSMKVAHKVMFIAGGMSVLALAAYLSVVINTTNVETSKAIEFQLMAEEEFQSGEAICRFDFENNSTTVAAEGSSAEEIDKRAIVKKGGVNNSLGLSAGLRSKGINMVMPELDAFNADGLDISMDFACHEKDGSFFRRGSSFDFGVKNGKLFTEYRVTAPNGKSYTVSGETKYEVPEDKQFRNYRFLYTPSTGKGEILVDNVVVWSNSGVSNSRLTWKEKETVYLGYDMDGGGTDEVIFDNILVRYNGKANRSPMQLLSFSADLQGNQVAITWHTLKEMGTEDFVIEKSSDTRNFQEIGRIPGAGYSDELKAYSTIDATPATGVSYYRLSLSNSTAKSVWMPVVAIRLKPEMLTSSPGATSSLPEIPKR